MKVCLCLGACLIVLTLTARAQCCNPAPPPVLPAAPVATSGSTAFCLFETPPTDSGKRKWINLGIVQYLELSRNDLRIYYGGGNFGGGYEERIPLANPADGPALIDRIKQAAAACR